LAKDKIFNGRLIIENVRIINSILIVEQEVGPRVPPLIVVVVVAEPVIVAIKMKLASSLVSRQLFPE
jgi:hypothetical protein